VASLHEVDVGAGDFSTRFEVRVALRDPFTADQVRALLSPRVQQALLELNAAEGGLIGDRPAFRAALGTRLWSVIPGTVLTSIR
jgi:hypothetical protein